MIPASTRALAKDRPCFPITLAAPQTRRFAPIERTVKAPGHLVLGNIHKPMERVA